jgi:hypothetical protein
MIFDKSNQADFIENRKCQWHFQNSNILKLLIHINIKILFIYLFILGLKVHTSSTTIRFKFSKGSNISGIVLKL